MNKNYNLKLDLQFRCNNSIMKFNQFDNNTSDFFMRITNGGKLIDIEKAIVVLATIKPSGKVASQFVEVENGLVYADLKANMKDEIGTYTAKAMLILEDERVVTDVISYEVEEDKIFSLLNDTVEDTEDFTLLTDMLSRLSAIETNEEQRVINEAERILSEENRKTEEAKRVEAELIRQHEEADRAKYDATRESNENIRKQNESIRLANETNRIDEEAKRVEEENKRKLAEEERNANYDFMTEDEERRRSEANAHKEAEVLRVSAENTRVNEEAKRRTTEQARVSAENTRVNNENTRETNETTRQTNETQRVEAETQRKNRYNSFIADAEANANNFENYTNTAKVKEEERKSNELDRKSQEDRRVSNEVERISNENTRKANEVVREKNEASRQNTFTNKVNEVDKKIVELNTTKDNFVSSVNTKVDTKISELDTAKSDMTNTVTNKIDEVENRFNALTSKQQQDAEVIDARDGETSLKARLDRDIEKAKQVYVNVEGSNISTDSSVGYAKDVEILGNTIQSASNLADIRSVGDKVEGQELYEIPVLSCGKNLFDHNIFKNEFVENQRIGAHGGPYSSEGFTMLKGLKEIPKFWFNKTLIHNFVGCIAFYSDTYDGSLINRCYQDKTYAVPQNARYFRFEYQNYKKDEFQLEEGTQATPYETYIEDKLTILSPTPLEKVGDVCDRIIEKDGVWGVEKNVYTATSDCFLQDSKKQLWHLSKSKVPSWISKNIWNEISNMVMCNYYGEVATYNEVLVTEGIFIDHKGTSPNIIIGTNDTNINSLPSDLITKYQLTTPQFIPLPHDQQIKLRTFANKTNISFGCEIEGTIKAQVPKSLGATVNTHTEQIRSLNNELNRVKKLEESTVSTVTTESDFTTVEATSNGYFEDVKLEGKTLVNIHPKATPALSVSDRDNPKYNITKKEGYIKVTGSDLEATQYRYVNMGRINFGMFKPNTTYTVVFTKFRGISRITIQNGDSQNTIINGYINAQDNKLVYTFVTKEELVKSAQILYLLVDSKSTTLDIEVENPMIFEGDLTANPPSGYFEGLKSVSDGVDEVSVESVKNLLDYTKLINKVTDGSTGVVGRNDNRLTLDVNDRIEIYSPQIYVKCRDTFIAVIGFVEKGGVPIFDSGYLPLNTISNLSLPSETKYITINAKTSSDTPISKEVLKNVFIYHQSDKKRLLYYNEETQAWEKPILREWDSIEKHSDGKYYYHVRSKEGDYVEGDESLNDCITDLTVSVKKLAEEKVYECTNIDLITYANETNYIIESGAIAPKTTLKVHNNISNVVSLLQKKVSLLESNVKASQEVQDMMILETDMRMLDIELALMEFIPMTLNLGGSNMLRSATYFNFLKNHIINETYEKEYLENVMNKYLATGRINQDEYNELYKMLYPPVYDIELPIEY